MRRLRTALAIVAAIGALALTGCAASPDLSGLESDLGEIDGVNGAMAYTTHSGAPWNTQVVVLLFLDDPSGDAVVASAQSAAPVLADDPAASGNEVSLYFIDGERGDYASRSEAFRDSIPVTSALAETLGVTQPGSESLRLSPDDVSRIADGS